MDPTWTSLPILAGLHDQWWRARAGRVGSGLRPFSRDWESLLADAGLTSIDLRREAECDARMLAGHGLLVLRPPPRRPGLIARIQVPVARECDLAGLFGDPVAPVAASFDPASFDWEPELAFLKSERVMVAPDELIAMNHFLRDGGRSLPEVPTKERSLTIFGDEKRLDALAVTTAFGNGRLTLAQLRAFAVPEPLPWMAGAGPEGCILVVENLSTWHSFAEWNATSSQYAAIVYGAGYRFLDGIGSLAALGPLTRIDYFGDLDPEGIRIPLRACERCRKFSLPPPGPLVWAYEWLLARGKPASITPPPPLREDCESDLVWLPEPLRAGVGALFLSRHRIAQEWLGRAHLQGFAG